MGREKATKFLGFVFWGNGDLYEVFKLGIMTGIFNRLFTRKDDQPGTGIYRFSNGTLDQLPERPGNGSINAIVEFLGYKPEQVHTVSFVPLHTDLSGNVNFYNLIVAHYSERITIDEFRSVNKGRYIGLDDRSLKCGHFTYYFDNDGYISNVDNS